MNEPTSVPELVREAAATGENGRRGPGVFEVTADDRLEVDRGDAVVCIPVYGAFDLFVQCLQSVLSHSPDGTSVLVADDASPDPAIREFVLSLESAKLRHRVFYLRQAENLGFVGNVNTALAMSAPADAVVLNSDCVVAANWLEGLRDAACCDTNVATATSLTNNGTILSVPFRNRPIPDFPQEVDFAQAASRVYEQSLRIRPRIPTAIGHCMFIRRQAIDLVGYLDLAFSPGYGEEVDFSQRCLAHGMVHVAADDVLVLHYGGGSFGAENAIQKENDLIVAARYPYYDHAQRAAGRETRGPLAQALAVAKHAICGMSVTIDGRILGPVVTGTQVHVLEVIRALDRLGDVRVRVILPPDPGRYALDALSEMRNVESIEHDDVDENTERTTIAHRPYQVSSDEDLELIGMCGDRVVVTHQDLIAYRNPSYFASFAQWENHRRLTRIALSTADLVLFFSGHAASDAKADQLVDESRSQVVYIGVDHAQGSHATAAEMPAALAHLQGEEFMVQIGTDYQHKNRGFAVRLLGELREQHGWQGHLVLVGPRVQHGSSRGVEAATLIHQPDLADKVVNLGAVSEAEKNWLLKNAAAVVFPTLYEGFGLLPFEAAAQGTPCLFAPQTSTAELLPENAATLVPWDVAACASAAIELLRDTMARQENVRAINEAGEKYTWEECGRELLKAYERALFLPDRDASKVFEEAIEVRREGERINKLYDEMWFALNDEERRLLGPEGGIEWTTQRTALKLSQNSRLSRVVFGLLRIGHKTGRALRRVTGNDAVDVDDSARKYLARWNEQEYARMSDRARAALEIDATERR